MYKSTIFNIFNHVPIKKKYIRAKEAPFMSKELQKAIQKNLCKKLLKNTKKTYFENRDTKRITDNRSFWRTVLPLFTQNSSKGEKINLVDDGKTISNDEDLYETFNLFCSNVVLTLNIPKPKFFPVASVNLDPIMSVIKSFDTHPSIVKRRTKRLIQPSISEKLAVMNLKRLALIST